MAIAPSKLGRFVDRYLHSDDDDGLVRQLRQAGLVSEDASDSNLRATFRMAREEDSALSAREREYNSPEEGVRVFLAPYLTGKGMKWAVPIKSLDLPDDDARSRPPVRWPWWKLWR
jgi:hypothetical protein